MKGSSLIKRKFALPRNTLMFRIEMIILEIIADNFIKEGRLYMLKKMVRPVSFFLVFTFLMLDFTVHSVQAQMIDTNTVIEGQLDDANRAQVAAFLAREDVKLVMTQHGVDSLEAQKRVESLSSAELSKIANAMEQLPAGGDGLSTLVGAAVLVFLVLLITDILGFTHVFSFVNHQR
jgi:NACalpha-BTF3-like transcription factor